MLLATVAGCGAARRLPASASASASAPAPAPALTPAPPGGTRVVMLGTGTPNADPERSGPSVAIVVGDTPYLVDLGPGVVRRAAAAHRKGVAALRVQNLRRAFVTHLHSDHTAGYADFILTPAVLGRAGPIEVYGPPGLKAMTAHLLEAYRQDLDVRLKDLEPGDPRAYVVAVHEIQPGVVYRDRNVVVRAFEVSHGAWRPAFGFRFETADRTVVISGDTTATDAVALACGGCDVLVHEVYSAAALGRRPEKWQRYHRSYHTSSTDLATIAARARPKLLVLYHQLLWGATEPELVREVRGPGGLRVVSAHDLDVY
jgi:ribonuclease BN (tRNA processing enzyme)